jgi:hypothetical protein
VRRLLFCADGSLRKTTKPAIVIWLLLFLAALWLVIPSSS